jgi:Family of unknown function (DUF5990)
MPLMNSPRSLAWGRQPPNSPICTAFVIPLKPGLAADPFPGDAEQARWDVTVTVRGSAGDGYDFTGPPVGGDRTDRHLGLVWGDVPGDGTLHLFRAAKLRLTRRERCARMTSFQCAPPAVLCWLRWHVADLADDHRADAGRGLDGVTAVMAVRQFGSATFSWDISPSYW